MKTKGCVTPKIVDLHSPLHFDHPRSSCSSYATYSGLPTLTHRYFLHVAISSRDWEAACQICSSKSAHQAIYWGKKVNSHLTDLQKIQIMSDIIEDQLEGDIKYRRYVKEIRSRDIVFITGETFWGVDDNLQGRNIMGLILMLYRHRFTR